jgi:hypothetical protein
MTEATATHQRLSSAERMRASRERRRNGLRMVPFAIRDSEIDALVTHGLLEPGDHDNRRAIARALGILLDRIPVARWQAAMQLRGRP